jgi:D-amino peptidase
MRLWVLTFFALAASGIASGQSAAPLKVYISADMEGIGGVSTWDKQSSPKGADYEKFRKLMTLEVNAAIAGAYDAGASEVLVSDSHWDGQNIDPELLDRRARMVRAWPRPLGMMQGIDDSFAAAVFVGYHASEGQANAILAHTDNSTRFFDVKLNGVTVPEAGINAAIAGEFGVPVVFLSGDQTIGQEATRLLGAIETAAVKIAGGFYSATMLHPEDCQRLIREGVKRGVEKRRQLKPYKLARPVKLEVTFKRTVDAEVVSYFQGVERPRGNVIVYTANDMLEASRFFNAIGFLSVE